MDIRGPRREGAGGSDRSPRSERRPGARGAAPGTPTGEPNNGTGAEERDCSRVTHGNGVRSCRRREARRNARPACQRGLLASRVNATNATSVPPTRANENTPLLPAAGATLLPPTRPRQHRVARRPSPSCPAPPPATPRTRRNTMRRGRAGGPGRRAERLWRAYRWVPAMRAHPWRA